MSTAIRCNRARRVHNICFETPFAAIVDGRIAEIHAEPCRTLTTQYVELFATDVARSRQVDDPIMGDAPRFHHEHPIGEQQCCLDATRHQQHTA